jgi:large subunit ribosomal protein L15
MKLNSIKPAEGSKRERRRVGRGIGSTLGKTCGRGHKGQYARTGKGKVKPGFEGGQMPLQRRLPKVGFRSKLAADTAEVLLYSLAKVQGDLISLETLRAAHLIPAGTKKARIVKQGEVARALTVGTGVVLTTGAKTAIEAAGGKVE